jgi:hypothetical protein
MSQLDKDFDETQEKVWLRAYEVPCWREEIASTGFSLAGRMANDRRSAAVARSLYKFKLTKEEDQDVWPNATHSDVSIELTGYWCHLRDLVIPVPPWRDGNDRRLEWIPIPNDTSTQTYGGYSPWEFDVMINQGHFFRLGESLCLLRSRVQWMVTPGQGPTVLGRLPA